MIFPPKTCKEEVTRRSLFCGQERTIIVQGYKSTPQSLQFNSMDFLMSPRPSKESTNNHHNISQGQSRQAPRDSQILNQFTIEEISHENILLIYGQQTQCHHGLGDYTRYGQVSTSNPIHRKKRNIMGSPQINKAYDHN